MELRQVFQNRRSARSFDPEQILDESLIRQIYDYASLAPSSFNLQPWKIILVSEPENKARLRKCAMDQPKVTEASHVAVLLGDLEAYEDMDPILDDFVTKGYFPDTIKGSLKDKVRALYEGDNARAFAGRNVGLFAMAFMATAYEFGVDTHPMDGFSAPDVRREFHIPDRYEIVMLVALGIRPRGVELKPRPERKPFDYVFINESF